MHIHSINTDGGTEMAKKGASQSGSGAARSRGKDQAMAAHLPPAPKAWRSKPDTWPYHNNLGARSRRGKKFD